MAGKHRLERPDHLEQIYLAAQVEMMAHRQTRRVLESVLDGRARRGRPAPPIDERVDPLEVRVERAAQRTIHLLDDTDMLTLADWTDLLEFHAFGETNARLTLMRLDDDDFVRRILDVPAAQLDDHVQEQQLVEARIAATVRRFYRLASPAEKRALVKLVEMLDESGHGIILYRDGDGERHCMPFVGTRDAVSRAG